MLKTLYRSPVRTILTLILLGATAFALYMQVAQYAVGKREFQKAVDLYYGIGFIEIEPSNELYEPYNPLYIYTDPRLAGVFSYDEVLPPLERYSPLPREMIDAIAALPHISSVSERYMTAGVSTEYIRLLDADYFSQFGYHDYRLRAIIEATLVEVLYRDYENGIGFEHLNNLNIEDIIFLNELPPLVKPIPLWFVDGIDIYNVIVSPRLNHPIFGTQIMYPGLWPDREGQYDDYAFDLEFLESLSPGSRYVFVLQMDRTQHGMADKGRYPPYLGDYFTDYWCEPVQLLDGAGDDYLSTDEYSAIRELIEMTNADLHTFDMVYTENMGAIRRFAQGEMIIADGRALSIEDNENRNEVCVVSLEFADMYELSVGDMLLIDLGTELFEQYSPLGAQAVVRERYNSDRVPSELEIVGIYADMDYIKNRYDNPHWDYSNNTIFVPRSLLPVDDSELLNHVFAPSEVSFIVDDAWSILPFLEETAPLIEGMGLTLFFNDAGWPDVADAFREADRLAVLNVAIFSVAALAAAIFAVYLFIGRKKKEFAIMRALGANRKTARRALLVPLTILSGVSVVLGCCAAWIYMKPKLAETGALPALERAAIDVSVPLWAVVCCLLGQLVIVLLFAYLSLLRLSKKQPIALLKG